MKWSRWGDDSGSLPFAMLLALVGFTLSAVLVPVAITQIRSTRAEAQRTHALHAAQAGLDVALGQIRAARDASGNGVLASLPCGPLTGRVGAGGSARYNVTIDYLTLDPQGQSDAWVTTNRMTCATGPASTPTYALLRSHGTDEPDGAVASTPGRDLRATYPFRMANQNTYGGLIHAYRSAAGPDLCLDAGSTAPATGANVQMQPCNSASSRQMFAYNTNLTLVLVTSRTPVRPYGMCLEAGAVPHAAGRVVQFQPCEVTTDPDQQWIFNGFANFEGTTDGSTPDGFCFNVQSPDTSGSFVVLGTGAGCRGTYNNVQTFAPEAAAGAGSAGTSAAQLVNVGQFSRCAEVTGESVSTGYLIAQPCTQATSTTTVAWNQKWTLPAVAAGASSATGRVSTTHPSTGTYCLRSPGSVAAGQYVTLGLCPGGATPADMTWTVHTDTGTYATSYQVVDGYGYCLAPTNPSATPPDLHSASLRISKLVLAACDGSTTQKWNAPPSILRSLPLRDISER